MTKESRAIACFWWGWRGRSSVWRKHSRTEGRGSWHCLYVSPMHQRNAYSFGTLFSRLEVQLLTKIDGTRAIAKNHPFFFSYTVHSPPFLNKPRPPYLFIDHANARVMSRGTSLPYPLLWSLVFLRGWSLNKNKAEGNRSKECRWM